MDAINIGPSVKNKMATVEQLKCMLWTTLVNAISLEPFPQSTSNFVFILSRGRTLLTLGHLLKTRWPPSNFLNCMLWTTLLSTISLEWFTQSTLNMKFVFKLSRGPSAINKMAVIELFKMYAIWTSLVNAISLESFHKSTSNLIYDVILPKGHTLLIFGFLLNPR